MPSKCSCAVSLTPAYTGSEAAATGPEPPAPPPPQSACTHSESRHRQPVSRTWWGEGGGKGGGKAGEGGGSVWEGGNRWGGQVRSTSGRKGEDGLAQGDRAGTVWSRSHYASKPSPLALSLPREALSPAACRLPLPSCLPPANPASPRTRMRGCRRQLTGRPGGSPRTWSPRLWGVAMFGA